MRYTYTVTINSEVGGSLTGVGLLDKNAVTEFEEFDTNDNEVYTIKTDHDIDYVLDQSKGVIEYTSEEDFDVVIDTRLKQLENVRMSSGITHAQGSVPNCPFCNKVLERESRCEHFVGVWNYWFSENDAFKPETEGATHYLVYNTENSGVDFYFLCAGQPAASR